MGKGKPHNSFECAGWRRSDGAGVLDLAHTLLMGLIGSCLVVGHAIRPPGAAPGVDARGWAQSPRGWTPRILNYDVCAPLTFACTHPSVSVWNIKVLPLPFSSGGTNAAPFARFDPFSLNSFLISSLDDLAGSLHSSPDSYSRDGQR